MPRTTTTIIPLGINHLDTLYLPHMSSELAHARARAEVPEPDGAIVRGAEEHFADHVWCVRWGFRAGRGGVECVGFQWGGSGCRR